jgi:AraC-like DNA-binding protein
MSQNLPAVLEELHLDPETGASLWFHRSENLLRPFHRHVELEANFVTRGHATYLIENHRVRLARRDLLWLFPAQNHVLIEQSSDFSMWIGVWKPEFLHFICRASSSQMLLQDDPRQILHRRLSESESEEIKNLCERISAQESDLYRAGLAYLLLQFWHAFEQGQQNAIGGAVHPAVERAARLLRDQNPPPSVPVLAREVGLSPSRLSRLFAAQTGLSLTEFRATQCLQRALRLCDETDLSLSEIAMRAGFGSYAQFHRTFRTQTGQSPATHRRTQTSTLLR